VGFLCWVAFGFLAIALAPEGWVRPQELGRLFPLILFPLVACSVSRLSPPLVAKAASTFVGVLGLSCLFALFQYFSNLHENASFMELLGFISAKHQVHAPGQGGRLVAGGFYFHRLKMAHVLLLGTSFLISRQIFSPLAKKARVLEGLALSLFVSTLFLTYTRAALLGLVAGGFIIIWFASKRWKAAAGSIGILVILVALSYSPVRERVLSIGDATASNERILLWSTAVNVIEDRPWGMGLGNYPSLIGQYYADVSGATHLPRTYAHNLLLSVWAEAGPLGALGYSWMWICVALACFWRLRKREFAPTHFIAAAGLMALIAMWTVGLTHDVLYHKPVCLTFAAFMGAVVGALYARNPSDPREGS
jgi:O-antigen ligase